MELLPLFLFHMDHLIVCHGKTSIHKLFLFKTTCFACTLERTLYSMTVLLKTERHSSSKLRKTILPCKMYCTQSFCTPNMDVGGVILWVCKQGGLYHFPPKFEHIFVAVITFFPFFCADTFITNLLLIVCALR